ncbi:hypothetical protein [Halorubrum halodurans]|uniref:hypothetical protein n=1 Tax=Halorubrum halodurans TaxID=1383851 RepID=UPI0015C5EAC4|nr:hypothetical protein [Halorubrum halodurans]
MQSRALGDNTFAGISRNVIANEDQYLFELDSGVPDISEIDKALLPTVGAELLGTLMVQATHDHFAFWERSQSLLEKMTGGSETYGLIPDLYTSVLMLFDQTGRSGVSTGELPLNGDHISGYLVYPLTEAVAKWFCQDYVEMDGSIKPGRAVIAGNGWIYGPPEDGDAPDNCSNLGGFLHHAEQVVAEPELQEELEQAREYIARLYGERANNIYQDVITAQRNRSLHGETEAPVEFGVLLTFIGILVSAKARN